MPADDFEHTVPYARTKRKIIATVSGGLFKLMITNVIIVRAKRAVRYQLGVFIMGFRLKRAPVTTSTGVLKPVVERISVSAFYPKKVPSGNTRTRLVRVIRSYYSGLKTNISSTARYHTRGCSFCGPRFDRTPADNW